LRIFPQETVKFIRGASIQLWVKKKLLKKKNKTTKLITVGFQKKNSNKEDNQVSFQTWARVPLVNFQQYKFDQAHLSIKTVLYPLLARMKPLSRGVFK